MSNNTLANGTLSDAERHHGPKFAGTGFFQRRGIRASGVRLLLRLDVRAKAPIAEPHEALFRYRAGDRSS